MILTVSEANEGAIRLYHALGYRDFDRMMLKPLSTAVTTFDDVRRIALALPEAEERLTWEVDITFRVRDKIFAMGGEGGHARLDQGLAASARPSSSTSTPRRSRRRPTSGGSAG